MWEVWVVWIVWVWWRKTRLWERVSMMKVFPVREPSRVLLLLLLMLLLVWVMVVVMLVVVVEVFTGVPAGHHVVQAEVWCDGR